MKIFTLIAVFCFVQGAFSQVGIGTTDPQAVLDINGSLLIQTGFKLGTLPTVKSTDEDFKLLTRRNNSTPEGEITVLDVKELKVAPINVVNYNFHTLDGDNLTNVNLQYDANKYIVGVANFRYTGDAIPKVVTPNGSVTSIGAFVVRAFVESGKWRLEIRNRFLDLQPNPPNGIEYHVTLIIYDKSYFRNLDVIITDLGGSNTGAAAAPPPLE